MGKEGSGNGRTAQIIALSVAIVAGGGSGAVVSKRAESSLEQRVGAIERTIRDRADYILKFERSEMRAAALAAAVAKNTAWIDGWPEGGELQVDRLQTERLVRLEEVVAAAEAQLRLGGRFTRSHGLGGFDAILTLLDVLVSEIGDELRPQALEELRRVRAELVRVRNELRQVSGMP